MSDAAHALRLARIDVLRSIRKHTDRGRGFTALFSVLMFALLVGAMTVGGGYLAARIGGALTNGLDAGPYTVVGAARGVVALFWLVAAVVFAVRAVGQRGTLTNAEGVLTTVTTREAFAGVLLSEYAYLLLWTLAPAAGVGVGVAAGTGVPSPVVAVPVAVAAAGSAAVAVGYTVGLLVRHLVTRLPFVARHKGALVVVVFLAYFLLLTSGALNRAFVVLFEPMQAAPTGWYADLLLSGTPGVTPSVARAVGSLILTAGLAALAVLVGPLVAARHWFSDPVLAGEPSSERTDDGVHESRVEHALTSLSTRATAALVVLAWRRAVRSPMKLLYAAYPLLFLAGVFANVLRTGRVPTFLPVVVSLFVVWAAGVVFTLNPLGDQGAALPSTLLTGVDGRQFVGAHVLAGGLVAVPLGTALTAIVAVLSPLDAGTAVALVAATPVVVVIESALAVGIGMAFPRFEAVDVTRSMKAVVPSGWAFALFSLHLFLTAGAAVIVYDLAIRTFVSAMLSFLLPFGITASPSELFAAAAVALVPLVVAPAASYRYAVRRYDGYRIE